MFFVFISYLKDQFSIIENRAIHSLFMDIFYFFRPSARMEEVNANRNIEGRG